MARAVINFPSMLQKDCRILFLPWLIDSTLSRNLPCMRRRFDTNLKLRGCQEISEIGMTGLIKNCKALRKLSCGSCMFGAKGMNAVIDHYETLEELSVKRLRGVHDCAAVISPDVAATSMKSKCLKELVNGQSFAPLIMGSKNLRSLKRIGCLSNWDSTLEMIGNLNCDVTEIRLEKIQVSDVGLSGISNCSNLEMLYIVKTLKCSNLGLLVLLGDASY